MRLFMTFCSQFLKIKKIISPWSRSRAKWGRLWNPGQGVYFIICTGIAVIACMMQVAMYQLTRLLAETIPPLYKLLDRLEVDPRWVPSMCSPQYV